jgi:hypothetical protein
MADEENKNVKGNHAVNIAASGTVDCRTRQKKFSGTYRHTASRMAAVMQNEKTSPHFCHCGHSLK